MNQASLLKIPGHISQAKLLQEMPAARTGGGAAASVSLTYVLLKGINHLLLK